MKVKAVQWTARKRQDGSSQIVLYVYAKSQKKYYSTGIHVQPENWSASNELVIGLPKFIKNSYNAAIEIQKLNYIKKLSEGIPADQMEATTPKEHRSLLEFLNLYIKEMEMGMHDIKPNTIGTYRSTRTRLYQFCEDQNINDLSFDDLDLDWYRQYFTWVKENKFGIHGFNKAVKNIKKVLKVAHQRDLHENLIYQHPEFKKLHRTSEQIYLTTSEIQKIEELDLSTMEHLDRERDRFLISYYFVMRWEDSTLINKEAIIENCGLNYSYTSKKTGIDCIVPVSKSARTILHKRKFNFGKDTNQKANVKIKEVGMLAGITQMIEQNGVKAPKFKFITTHTARRSAATNLYLEGMDLETIARVGGWKKLETLKTYLKASGMEVARNARKFDFFR